MSQDELRILPHSLEAEKALLGSLLIRPSNVDIVGPMLQPAMFFRRAHQSIYASIVDLADRKVEVDLLTLKDDLHRLGQMDEVGGPAYIAALTDGVPRSSNVSHYAVIVREKAALRQIIHAANTMMGQAYDAEASAESVIETADLAILDLQRGHGQTGMSDLRERSAHLFARIEHHVKHRGQLLGLDTGLQSVNDLTNGWQPGDMTILAARPSIGKTMVSLHFAMAAAQLQKRVAVFSLEMRTTQLENRMLAALSGVPLSRIQSGYLGEPDYERLAHATSIMASMPIFVDDRSAQTILDIRSACRRIRAEGGLDLVIIDYVQLMRGSVTRKGANRNDQVTDISRRTKVLADELSVPVIMLSQLNRASADRPDKRPILSDLRESGSLEQDSDNVVFCHRKHHLQSGTTNLIFEKQRNGSGGTLDVTIMRETQQVSDGPDPSEPVHKDEDDEPKKKRPPAHVFKRRS